MVPERNFSNVYLYRTTTLFLQFLFLGLFCISNQVFAKTITVKLHTGNIYKGQITAYTDSTVVLEIDPVNKTLLTIKYSTIELIRRGGLTQNGPIDRTDIQNFLPQKKAVKGEAGEGNLNKSLLPADRGLLEFSACYNDSFLFMKMESIDSMNGSDFEKLLLCIDKCWREMYKIGIIVNPCCNRVYKRLHTSAPDSLTNREFQVLQKLRKQYFDFQKTVEWDVNLCADSVYTALQAKSGQKSGGKEMLYLEQLHRECKEMKDDLDDDYEKHWVTERAMHSDKIFEHYDPPVSGKIFFTIGGILFIPGVILPIVGGVLVGNDNPETVGEGVAEVFGELFGRLFLGLGIVCDVAGISLLSVGVMKYQNAEKFEKLKNEYELYKQKRAGGLSINFNFTF